MVKVISVFQSWIFNLPMQQQSVLLLATRGPDGFAKYHPSKELLRRYRAAVLKSAYYGRALEVDEPEAPDFMSLEYFSDDDRWQLISDQYFSTIDELPMHYHMHLLHGAQIVGFHHPTELFRDRWSQFYRNCCDRAHMIPELEVQMDDRLSDWYKKHWSKGSGLGGHDIEADDNHYLFAIRARMNALYERATDPRTKEQISDELDWINEKLGVME